MSDEDMLAEAHRIIHGQRQKDYGSPLESFNRIADMWSAYLGRTVTAEDVANMMILLKVSRASNGYHRDHYVDIAGYVGCVDIIIEEKEQLWRS